MVPWPSDQIFHEGGTMQALELLKTHFRGYVWRHVLSILLGLMLLRGAKRLTALQHQKSVPTLSRTLNLYPWPLEGLIATRRRLISQALKKRHRRRRGGRPTVYLIIDDTVIPKRGKVLPCPGWDSISPLLRAGW